MSRTPSNSHETGDWRSCTSPLRSVCAAVLAVGLLGAFGCGDDGQATADGGAGGAVDAPSGRDEATADARATDAETAVTVTPRSGKVLFNAEQRQVRDVTVTAAEIVIDAANDEHGLYEKVHNQPDVATLQIKAQKVTVRSPLRLPQTQLTIEAKQLVFEDADEASPAVIDLTPLPWPAHPRPKGQRGLGADGADGADAPDMTLILGEILAPDQRKRFIARGGDGRDAMPGAAGNGPTVPNTTIAVNGKTLISVVGVRHHWAGVHHPAHDKGSTSASAVKNSTPNYRSGVPGGPGRGATIRTTLEVVRELADVSPGKPGRPGPSYKEIAARSWKIVDGHWDAIHRHYASYNTKWSGTTTKRPAAAAPGPKDPQGKPGEFVIVEPRAH